MIDLRSDTVSQPSEAMREAIAHAAVGDDVFGDDPTVNELESFTAKLLDKEAAMFVPSGTQSNLCALLAHCQRGDEYIVGDHAHTYMYEGGGAAVLGSIQPQPVPMLESGMLDLNRVREAVKPNDIHFPRSRLLCIENTTNGKAISLEELAAGAEAASDNSLLYHLDGARLWNALEVTKETPIDFGRVFDTISVCLSKGLGCPVGSLLLGSKQHIREAIRYRKIFGGGMRQIGYLAAAGTYAINHQLKDLKEDHRKAKELEGVLQMRKYVQNVEPVTTNILIFSLMEGVSEIKFIKDLNKRGIDIISLGKGKLRIVTHRDYTQNHHDYVLTTLIKMNEYA